MSLNLQPEASGTESNIAQRFEKSLRNNQPRVQCPKCNWQGPQSTLAKHQSEHKSGDGESLDIGQIPAKNPVEPIKTSRNIGSDGASMIDNSHMAIDEPNLTSPVSRAGPPRRIARGGARDRQVDAADFNRGSLATSKQESGPPANRQLFDHKTGRGGNAPAQTSLQQNARVPRSAAQPAPAQSRLVKRAEAPLQSSSRPIPPSQNPAPVLLRKPNVAPVTSSETPSSRTIGADEDEGDKATELILQPETRPISQEQLVAEVKGIYAGLVMVEAKCIEVDSKQAAAASAKDMPRLNNEQWQALIALHRTLLHEHHDFFLASQHPSAAPSLRKLASKYAMPARMWRHGIHSFLELLRHRLPDSFEHMLAFIYLAYSMMALLYETVPAFADTWVECLGDLGRYRMAIEEGDPRDRETWMNVSRYWYSNGCDRLPHVGRLYHHLAILSRPVILQQLFFYCKALAVAQPFSAARESILTLFDPNSLKEQDTDGSQTADITFVLLHSISFSWVNLDVFDDKMSEYLDQLDRKITESKLKFKIPGVFIAICGIASLSQYNHKSAKLKGLTVEKEDPKACPEVDNAYKQQQMAKEQPDNEVPPGPVIEGSDPATALEAPIPELDVTAPADIALKHSQTLAFGILALALDRDGDPALQPHIHVWLVYLDYMKYYHEAMALMFLSSFPWEQLARYATNMIRKRRNEDNARIFNPDQFPIFQKGRPLPEEYLMRGLEMCRRTFPYGYFQRISVDDDERMHELPSMSMVREEKILWLLMRFANYGPWLHFDESRWLFTVTPQLKARLAEVKNTPNTVSKSISKVDIDSDTEMEMSPATMVEEDENIDSDENPSEIKELLTQQRNLRRQLAAPGVSAEEEIKTKKATAAFTSESFKSNYTVVTVDTNSLVKNVETYRTMIASNQWSIVIPYSVVTELHGLQRNEGKVAETAEAALALLEQSLQGKKNLRIVTAKGNSLPNITGQYKELIDDYKDDDSRKNLDDIIIGIAKAQGELVTRRSMDDGVTRPVVLITDDTVMRVKAMTRGVAAVRTKQWIKYLSQPDNAQKRKYAVTFHALSTRYPNYDEEKVWEAVCEAGGDENSATTLLKTGTKKKRIRANPDGRHSLLS